MLIAGTQNEVEDLALLFGQSSGAGQLEIAEQGTLNGDHHYSPPSNPTDFLPMKNRTMMLQSTSMSGKVNVRLNTAFHLPQLPQQTLQNFRHTVLKL